MKLFNLQNAPKSVIENSGAESSIRIRCTMDKSDGPLELSIMDTIGSDGFGGGISASDIQTVIAAHKDREIHATINSLGGSFYEGLAIANAIISHEQPTQATVTGIAYSAASLIAAAFDTVVMHEASDFGIHRAWTFAMGNAEDLKETIAWLERVDEHAITVYQAKTGSDRGDIYDWLVGEGSTDGTVFTAQQAVEAGFADRMISIEKDESDAEQANAASRNAAMLLVDPRAAYEIRQKQLKARLGR